MSNGMKKRIVSLAQSELHIYSLMSRSSSTSFISSTRKKGPNSTGNKALGPSNSQSALAKKINSTYPQIQQVSNFYSNDKSGSNKNPSPFKEIKEAPGKVKKSTPISKTPRGQAKSRATKPSKTKSSIDPRGGSYHISIHEQQQHLTHFVTGGTPSDPVKAPFRLTDYGDDSLYTLVLLRHGESEWNSLNRYTGWCDVNLTEKGRLEARAAGRLLNENGVEVDHVFTSVLKRAIFTTNMALNMAKQHYVPITKTWRLNERHYGALQGYNKDTAYEELGIDQELVMEMRRSYDTAPPKMEDDHPYWHGNDRR